MLREFEQSRLIAAPALALVALLMIERVSIYALGLHPSSEALWWVVMNIRTELDRLYFMIGGLDRLAMGYQLLILGGAAAALLFATRVQAARSLFLLAHGTAIVVALLAFDPSSQSSSLRLMVKENQFYLHEMTFHFSALQAVLLCSALLSCVLAHMLVFRKLFGRSLGERLLRLNLALA